MVKWLLGLALVLGVFLLPRHALAVPCTQVLIFTTGEVLTASVLNANPANEVTCINNIDNSNIGANGIYASQIIPTNAGQASFGGALAYIFPNGIAVNGTGITASNLAYSNIAAAALPFQWNCQTGIASLGASSGPLVSNTNASALDVACNGTHLVAVNTNGDMGLAASLRTGNNNTWNWYQANSTSCTDFSEVGSSNAISVQNVTSSAFLFGCHLNAVAAIDTSGDLGIAGNLQATGRIFGAAHNGCTSVSGLPCALQTTCTLSGGLCTITQSVPSGSVCSVSALFESGFLMQSLDSSISGTTLTAHVDYSGGTNGGINTTCD